MSAMRVLNWNQLFIDPDVQLEFAVKKSHWQKMAADWHPERAGFLIVVPAVNGGFSIIDGRHRFKGGTAAGVTEWRCDVHDEISYEDVEAKANLKLGFDYHRRRVTSMEHYIERLMAKDPVVIAIDEIITTYGFQIGAVGKKHSPRNISAVSALERSYEKLGPEKFRKAMRLATTWHDDPSSTNADWLNGLFVFVKDGYEERLTLTSLGRLQAAAPAVVIRRSAGEVTRRGATLHRGASSGSFSPLAIEIAQSLRKIAKLKPNKT